MRDFLAKTYKLLSLPLFLAAFLLFSSLANSSPAPETWMVTGAEMEISAGKVISGEEYRKLLMQSNSVLNDLSCEPRSVNFAPENHPSAGMKIDGCWYSTSVGLIEEGGYALRPTGWEVGGYVNSFNSQLFPTKNTGIFIEYGSEQSITFRRNNESVNQTRVTPADTGWDFPIFHEWVYPNSGLRLENMDGTPWEVSDNMLYGQVWYSSNGKFVAFWHTDGYFVLVDLNTLTLKVVRSRGGGHASLAISDSGRYVAINNYDSPGLELIDTKDCYSDSPYYVSSPTTCTSRILENEYIEAGSPEAYGVLPVFYGDDLLGFYIPHEDEYREYVLRAPNTREGTYYLALGDSFVSGEGISEYRTGTDDKNNKCHLAGTSYPYLIGLMNNLDSAQSIACSGAKMKDILHKAQYPNNPKNNSLGVWLPGKKPQIEQIELVSPDIVTVGIVGNDIGFGDMIYACINAGHCFETYEERFAVALEMNAQFDDLVALYLEIRERSLAMKPDANIYATGYPQIAQLGGDCGKGINLSDKDIEFSVHAINHLNNVIRAATKRAGVTFVNIESAFGNQRLCGEKPWAMNSLVRGDDKPVGLFGFGPYGNESFHPNSVGHIMLAQTIADESNNFNIALPWPDPTSTPPNLDDSLLLNGLSPSGGEIFRRVHEDQLLSTSITKDNMHSFSSTGSWLKPNSIVSAGFTSTFVGVGEYSVDSYGNIDATFEVPKELPTGFHTFHLYGIDSNNRSLDIYKSVFVGQTEEDWDGDDIPNSLDSCINTAGGDFCYEETDKETSNNSTKALVEPISHEHVNREASVDVEKENFPLTVLDIRSGGVDTFQVDSNNPVNDPEAKNSNDRQWRVLLVLVFLFVFGKRWFSVLLKR